MSVMEQKPGRTRRSFTDEFKRDAVAMVLDDGNKIADDDRRLGIGEGTLGNWVAQARTDRGERAGLTTSERAELARPHWVPVSEIAYIDESRRGARYLLAAALIDHQAVATVRQAVRALAPRGGSTQRW